MGSFYEIKEYIFKIKKGERLNVKQWGIFKKSNKRNEAIIKLKQIIIKNIGKIKLKIQLK